jgi:CheY-like chemotaxis protein
MITRASANSFREGRLENAMKRILVVDDSKTAQLMSQMILKGHSYEVLFASDGQEAVEKALATGPDLILMDLVMPKMDGLAALRAIRSIDSIRDVPVIVVSTRSEAEPLEKSYELGCNDYIVKPVDGVELLAKIRSLIGE